MRSEEWIPNPLLYLFLRLSLLIFPTAYALLYVEDADDWRWRQKKKPCD